MAERKIIRCAVYTRKSSEYGLEQEFNSLDAQRESCEAYVKSQAHEGWKLLPAYYDDGGVSGGTLERPAIQKLLADVKDGKVDVIVVYKVDRLTRSLADFAKLVELFDAHNASFVSVTQQFNTTNSMGRLTLNVLLSFAQFEREVTAERIRDKVSASKKRGLWLGGVIPLGYNVKDKKLIINEQETEQVRMIFQRYLELPSVKALKQDLDNWGVVTRTRTLSNGKVIGGIPFYVGPLGALLKNRIYNGEVSHDGKVYAGQHQPIVDRQTFEAVQAKLAANESGHKAKYAETGSILMGRIFDEAGNKMTPVHTRNGAKRYRYYVSPTQSQDNLCAVQRIPAAQAEEAVLKAVREHANAASHEAGGGTLSAELTPQNLIEDRVECVVVSGLGLTVMLKAAQGTDAVKETIKIPHWVRGRARHREIILSQGKPQGRRKSLKAERRLTLLTTIAKARRWAEELIKSEVTDINELARREGTSERNLRRALSLAFLAPDIIESALAGELPPDLVMTRISNSLPLSWSKQRQVLALS